MAHVIDRGSLKASTGGQSGSVSRGRASVGRLAGVSGGDSTQSLSTRKALATPPRRKP